MEAQLRHRPIMSLNTPLAKASHMAKANINQGHI